MKQRTDADHFNFFTLSQESSKDNTVDEEDEVIEEDDEIIEEEDEIIEEEDDNDEVPLEESTESEIKLIRNPND